jgi:hypothetical protein
MREFPIPRRRKIKENKIPCFVMIEMVKNVVFVNLTSILN